MPRWIQSLVMFSYGILVALFTMYVTSKGADGGGLKLRLAYGLSIALMVTLAAKIAWRTDNRASSFIGALAIAALGALVFGAAVVFIFMAHVSDPESSNN